MTTSSGLPLLNSDAPDEPGTGTGIYYQGRTPFDARHAPPDRCESLQRAVAWTEDQVVDAAKRGIATAALDARGVMEVCGAYLALQTELEGCRLALDEERNAHQGTILDLEAAQDDHRGEGLALRSTGALVPLPPRRQGWRLSEALSRAWRWMRRTS